VTATFTRNQRRSIRRRTVGRLDDGRRAFPVHPNDTEDMARAVFAAYDDELELGEQTLVDWCSHTADYQYAHGCDEWCERPSPRIVWTAAYPAASREPRP
jgi:hypothetical protein